MKLTLNNEGSHREIGTMVSGSCGRMHHYRTRRPVCWAAPRRSGCYAYAYRTPPRLLQTKSTSTLNGQRCKITSFCLSCRVYRRNSYVRRRRDRRPDLKLPVEVLILFLGPCRVLTRCCLLSCSPDVSCLFHHGLRTTVHTRETPPAPERRASNVGYSTHYPSQCALDALPLCPSVHLVSFYCPGEEQLL
jgi:hypothetical protein